MSLSDFSSGMEEALADLIRQRLEAEEVQRRAKQQEFQNQRTLNTEGFREREFGEGTRRFDLGHEIDTGNLGLRRDEFGLQRQQYEEGAPMRDASLDYTKAQTGDILRRPEAEQQDRDHDVSLANLQGTWGLRTIGAQGAEQRRTQSHGAGLKPAGTDINTKAITEANEIQDSLDLIDRIEKDPALKDAVGFYDARGLGKLRNPDGVTRFEGMHDQLVGRLELAAAGKLKGQGNVTDKERDMLKGAATALRRALSEGDYIAELGRIRQQFQRMPRLQSVIGGQAQIDIGNMGASNPNANLGGRVRYDENGNVIRGGG